MRSSTLTTPVVALLALMCAAPAVAASAPTPTITEFSSGLAQGAEPLGIVSGPEGDLWFTQASSSAALGRMTLPGGISSYSTLAATTAVTLGPDGRLWFAESGPGAKIGALEPAFGLLTEYTQTASTTLAGLTAGPEGDVWFTDEHGSESFVGSIAPATGAITEYKLPTLASKPAQITVGAEGALWFTEPGTGWIGKFNTITKVPVDYKSGITEKDEPKGIATGPEGDIWFTLAGKTLPAIGRLNPTTYEVTEFSKGLGAGTPQAIVTGSDGNLYFTDSTGALGQITPQGVITEFKTGLSEKAEPWGITSGPDGNIWFTEKAKPARIGRLTVAPSVGSLEAVNVTTQSATLTAKLGANAQATEYFFEYGPTPSYGTTSPTFSAGSSGGPVAVSLPLTGLSAGASYHFRVVAYNATGTTVGPDAVFTAALPPKPGALEKLPAGLESPLTPNWTTAPVLGSDAGAAPASGTVLVQNSSGAFVALSSQKTLPVGTVIDATHGVVRLLTALRSGKAQTVTVWGGIFQIAQSKGGSGLTRILLKGAAPSCGRHKGAHAAKKSAPKSRKLWAKDSHGQYSTYGANSVATVLGTEWETVDTCAGTLTRVVDGKVKVLNVHTHKTVLVSAGHSYLARR